MDYVEVEKTSRKGLMRFLIASKNTVIIPFLLLSACQTKQTNFSKVEKEIEIRHVPEEVLETDLFVEGPWPEEKWWEVFNDAQLSSAIVKALQDNPSLISTQARVAEANQLASVARAKLFPHLNGVFNALWGHFSEYTGQFYPDNLGLRLDYEFDFWSKNKNTFHAFLGELRAKAADYQEARLVLAASIADIYFEIQTNMRRYEILEQILTDRTRRLTIVELRKNNRIDSLIDSNRIKDEVAALKENIAAVEEEVKVGKTLLAILMGQNPDTPFEIEALWSTVKAPIALPENIGLNLLQHRPDLTAQLWRVTKSAKLVSAACAEFYPNIDLSLFGGVQSFDFQDLFRGKALMGTVFPKFNLPIFEGGKIEANYQAKIAAYEAAVYDYNDLLLRAANQVVSELTRYTSLNAQLAFERESLEALRKNYELTYSRYKHGIDSLILVLKADEKYLFSKLKEVELENAKNRSYIRLVKALGGGFSSST